MVVGSNEKKVSDSLKKTRTSRNSQSDMSKPLIDPGN